MDDLWMASDTTPSEIDAAIRAMLGQHHHEDGMTYVPARVLNLVVIADREWRGEIINRLDRVGRYYPSRTIVCSVDPGRRTLDARANISTEDEVREGGFVVGRESVVLDVGEHHLPHLDSIVDPLVVSDLPTVVWAPHRHPAGVDSLLHIAQVVLGDSLDETDVHDALGRAQELAARVHVVDLSWLRSTPWRERIAGTFEPPERRRELGQISSVTVRHRPDSAAAALLFLGWMASRLDWTPSPMIARDGCHIGRARSKRQEVTLAVQPQEDQGVPGLAGITIETAAGTCVSLDRGAGGLTKRRRYRNGVDSSWTVFGASRGEGGILGEGIRQAMLRDQTYGPALAAAAAMTI